MKKFIVDTGKKKYSVEANDAEHAVKLVKKINVKDRDAIVHRLKTPKDGYSWTVEYESRPYMYDLEFFKNKNEALSWAKRKRLNVIRVIEDSTFITRDEASQLQTVNALIEDEKAAVEAYDVAIENLCGKIPEESLQAIIAIRDDENRHIENLQAVVNGTVTEKNLEDSFQEHIDWDPYGMSVSDYVNIFKEMKKNNVGEIKIHFDWSHDKNSADKFRRQFEQNMRDIASKQKEYKLARITASGQNGMALFQTEKNLEDTVYDDLHDYKSAVKEAIDELSKIHGKYNEQDKVLVRSVLRKASAAIARAKSNWENWI